MIIGLRGLLPMLALSLTMVLSGCESSEDRAERYFKSGMELLAAGDEDRALVEFRNVFKYNGFHKQARQTYADIQLKRGDVAEAYSQYLRLIEQYPDTAPVRLTLAEIAIDRGDWDEAERHGRAALALDPASPGIMAVNIALDYRVVRLADDAAGIATTVARARDLLVTTPDNLVARRIVIDDLINGPEPKAALPELDGILALAPGNLEFHVLKLQLLVEAKDTAAAGAQLKAMFQQFPDNDRIRAGLVAWYMEQGDVDGAEAYLRQLAAAAGDEPAPQLAVVRLLQQARGNVVAQAELTKLIAAHEGKPVADLYRALHATIDFEDGEQTDAIIAMESILKSAAASEQTRSLKVMLAKMLQATGNSVGARARVEEILAEDPAYVEALKMRAAWLIEEDKPGEAIVDLRTALDQNPRDPSILMLMATAHERDGSAELATERLALAVEVSGYGAEESLRYAGFLLTQPDGEATAEKVMLDALTVSPTNIDLLRGLSEVLLGNRDWLRAKAVATQLRAVGTSEASQAADRVETAILLGQEKTDEGIAFLQSQIEKGGANIATVAQIIQIQVRSGKQTEARAYLDSALAKTPQDTGLRFLSAMLHDLMGESEPAETLLRTLIAEDPAAEQAVRTLYGILLKQNRAADAATLLTAALATQPESVALRWMKAGELEIAGDIDGAIQIYESLYAENSSNLIVANNLASLITTHRSDPESLERAFAVARRLRGSDQPAFQDTYGWIEYRRGNFEEALINLEPAAKGLADDPMVQLHVGLTYAALNRNAEATAALTRALELSGDSPLPQFQVARDALAKLATAPSP